MMGNSNIPNIYVAGHKGMVGSALVRRLKTKNIRLITKTKKELNLTNQDDVHSFFQNNKIDQVYIAAARVGGIYANNTFPAEFIYENLMIQTNIIHNAFLSGVKKLLFLGSSCIYPKNSKQPIKEDYLLTDKLEPTNEPYAIAKIAGVKMCESYNRQYGEKFKIDYRSVMPTNLYGPGDNYHPTKSHVIPALIYRFHEAKTKNFDKVTIWGSGKPKREFLFVDDLAEASIFIMNLEKKTYKKKINQFNHINIGSGEEFTIHEIAKLIREIVDYKGTIEFDSSKPDGVNRKLIDSSIIKSFGWKHKTNFSKGLKLTYENYINQKRILSNII